MKAGVAATTGTQITPTPDTGCTGLYVITVAQGATTVTAGNIATYANAPFLPQGGIVDGIQRNTLRYAADTGVANAYVVNINPGILTLSDGMEVNFKAANANTTSSTLNVCALGAYPVLNKFGQTLISGEIASGSHVTVKWSSTASSWFILDSTKGVPTVPTAPPGTNTTQEASTAFVRAAITALSLGTASTRNVGTGTNQIPDMSFFGGSSSSSGYQYFPNGTLIQWGTIGLSSSPTGTTIGVFPIAFPSAGYQIVVTHDNPLDSTLAYGAASIISPTQFRVNACAINTSTFTLNPGYAMTLRWLAIGK